jgi:DNA-binding winged helix-turn-helix (wHTH) protein
MSEQAQSADPATVTFDDWVLQRNPRELWRCGAKVRVQEQPLQILDELVSRAGDLVTREELIRRLWPKGIVDFDTSLNTAIRKLRIALGEEPDRPRYIETVPRKGYRFLGAVATLTSGTRVEVAPLRGSSPTADRAMHYPSPLSGTKRMWRLTTVIPGIGAALLLFAFQSNRSTPEMPKHAYSASEAITPNPDAFMLYLEARTKQPEIAPPQGAAPREQVLSLLTRAIKLDPLFAQAYLLRARVHSDYFMSNLDVSAKRIALMRADLAAARRLSGNDRLGTDVSSWVATIVDMNPEEGLRLSRVDDSADPAVLQARAQILATMGRFKESDEIFESLLALDSANQRLLRMRGGNLAAEGRIPEYMGYVRWLQQISPPERNPCACLYLHTGRIDFPRPSHETLIKWAGSKQVDSAELLGLMSELALMQLEHRHVEMRELLDRVSVESIRVAGFTGVLPGLGRVPVATLRGWNHLLLGDSRAAERDGRAVLRFVAQQQSTERNAWFHRLLTAQGYLFEGDPVRAAATAHEALRLPPAPLANVHMQTYREYLAAITLAWAGEHDEALAWVEKLSTSAPRVPPIVVARDPLLMMPLQQEPRYLSLQRRMDAESEANARLWNEISNQKNTERLRTVGSGGNHSHSIMASGFQPPMRKLEISERD